jgi:hypothetical protein
MYSIRLPGHEVKSMTVASTNLPGGLKHHTPVLLLHFLVQYEQQMEMYFGYRSTYTEKHFFYPWDI